jgi:hypothetical protein
MAAPISANARSTTYTYQGAAFTDGGLNIPEPAGATSLSVPPNIEVLLLNGFITLSAPLGDSLNNVSVTPTFIDISSGSALFQGVFAFSTNANGAIDGWSMSLNGTVFGPGGYTLTATRVDLGGVGGDSAMMSTTCTAFSPVQPPQNFGCGSTEQYDTRCLDIASPGSGDRPRIGGEWFDAIVRRLGHIAWSKETIFAMTRLPKERMASGSQHHEL